MEPWRPIAIHFQTVTGWWRGEESKRQNKHTLIPPLMALERGGLVLERLANNLPPPPTRWPPTQFLGLTLRHKTNPLGHNKATARKQPALRLVGHGHRWKQKEKKQQQQKQPKS